MRFWIEIARGYDLIKNNDPNGVNSVVTKLKNIMETDEETLAISSLEAWSLVFTKDFDKLIPITNSMIVCRKGNMPAWYKGVGFLIQGLMHLSLSSNQRFDLFQYAANNYKTHIIDEIPKISTPPNSFINTLISTYFEGLCILEANGTIGLLEELLSKLDHKKNDTVKNQAQGIIKAANLQIKIKKEKLQLKFIQENLNHKDEHYDPLFYYNLIVRFNCENEF